MGHLGTLIRIMQGELDERIEGNGNSGGGAVNSSKLRYLQVFSGYKQGLNTCFF